MYVDINTRKASPKTEWVRQNEKSDHWKRQTGLLIEQHQWILNNIWTESAGMLDALSQVLYLASGNVAQNGIKHEKNGAEKTSFLLVAERIFK